MQSKIALLGNMNNNNFSLLRYLRDLGVDAHLLLYSNDGKGSLSHFSPESDTWELEKWVPFIHQTDIPNNPITAFDFPISSALGFWSTLRSLSSNIHEPLRPVTRAKLRSIFSSYHRVIASGIAPAALARVSRRVDIFYPYATGVEFLGPYQFTSLGSQSLARRLFSVMVRQRQARGLRTAEQVIACDGITRTVLNKHRIKSVNLMTPMVYNRDAKPSAPITVALQRALPQIQKSSFSVLHHARLLWRRPESFTERDHWVVTKNSDWLVRSFAKLVAARPQIGARLFMIEYGPDVDATKRLVVQLGIQEAVTWLPKMARRELMWLLERVSLGVGEFMNPKRMIWGGTGWEVLASGKPLLQGFNFEDGEFETTFGCPAPPMLPVKTEADILEHLLFASDYPENAAQIGSRAREWFDTYNGSALAKKWLELVTDPAASHQPTISIVS